MNGGSAQSEGFENQRVAATIYTSISTYVATATLALLAGGVALATYFANAYHNLALSAILAVDAGVALCTSLYFGGKGLNKVAKDGAGGNWDISSRSTSFNCQAIFAFIGLIAMVVAAACVFVVGNPNVDQSAASLRRTELKVVSALDSGSASLTGLRQQLNGIRGLLATRGS